ncbi:epoxide hydrolase family protein [Pseudonocardia nigra]|uniref:epoxide hydrolase family protein n=1 Tax=Pseudonocardia nigra TaxID=1921578 RepID=UPI001C5F689F|nr:epoxide hydrolase family protein [Pseudonocardia nigra]
MSRDDEVRPFRIDVPDDELVALRDRLARVRWAPEPDGAGYGVPTARVRELVEHWRDRYDWRTWEARINSHPQFTTTIDGTNVHFLHVRSPEPDAFPLVLSHGWPGSVVEFLDVIGPLTDPRRHGLSDDLAFDVVIPSLPNFGFSGPTPDTRWGPRRIARAWATLMHRLGYARYGAVGNDWGSFISPELGRVAPDAVVGVHVTQIFSAPDAGLEPAQLSPADRAALDGWRWVEDNMSSYSHVQAQQPQTLAHALSDSPAGLLGWNSQVMDGLDVEVLLTHVSIHWLSGTAGSALRIYAEEDRQSAPDGPTTVPLGLAQFPNDLPAIRACAECAHSTIVSWNVYDRGGHYVAHQAPDLLTADIRAFFASLLS